MMNETTEFIILGQLLVFGRDWWKKLMDHIIMSRYLEYNLVGRIGFLEKSLVS